MGSPSDQNSQLDLYAIFHRGGSYDQAAQLQQQITQTTIDKYGNADERSLWESKRLGDVYYACGRWDDAKQTLDHIFQHQVHHSATLNNATLKCSVLNAKGLLNLELGDYHKARALTNECLSQRPTVENEGIAEDIYAAVLFNLGEFEECVNIRKALVEKAKHELSNELLTIQAKSTLSLTLLALGKGVHADAFYEQLKAVNNIRDILGSTHPITLHGLNVSGALDAGYNLRKAVASEPTDGKWKNVDLFRSSVRSCAEGTLGLKEVLGANHPCTLRASHNLVITLILDGQTEKAQVICQSIADPIQQCFPETDPFRKAWNKLLEAINTSPSVLDFSKRVLQDKILITWAGSAQWLPILIHSGAIFHNALYELRKMDQNHSEKSPTPRSPSSTKSSDRDNGSNSGRPNIETLMKLGRYEEVEDTYRQALNHNTNILGLEHPSTITAMDNLASALKYQCKFPEAERLLKKAIQLGQEMLGPDHPATLASMGNLASLYTRQGKMMKASELMGQVKALRRKSLATSEQSSEGSSLGAFGNPGLI